MTFNQATMPAVSEIVPKESSFNDYYHELSALLGRVDATLSRATELSATDNVASAEKVTTALQLLDDEGSELLNWIEMEIQTLPSQVRTQLRPYILHLRDTFSRHRTSARAIQAEIDQAQESNTRVRLLSGANKENDKMHNAQVDLEMASSSIVDSRKQIMETEAVGASILNDLQSQRATIARARNNLGTVDDGLETSSSIVSSMQRRAIINKIIIYIVAAVVAIACIAILYIRLFHPYSTPASTSSSNPPSPTSASPAFPTSPASTSSKHE